MPVVTFPPKITADRLKQIARLCGQSRSGTKAAITDRIVDGLQGFAPLAPGTRVLSIDLGIRNLAYSLLEVPGPSRGTSPEKKKKATKRKTPEPAPAQATSLGSVTPILHAWERLALIPKTPKPSKPKKKSRGRKAADAEDGDAGAEIEADLTSSKKKKRTRATKTKDESAALEAESEAAAAAAAAAAVAAAEADPTTVPVPVEDFSPARLSQLAVDLVLDRLLPLRPDIVTLERQRFRTVGGSGVFEWTLRVNSLESMLYAALATLRRMGRWPAGRVEAVVAMSVLEFMAVQEMGPAGSTIWAKTRQGDNKKVKKDIVGKMLQAGEGVRLALGEEGGKETGVHAVRREYVEKWSGTGTKRGKAGVESLKKLDDLADCLLQGIAFIRWQENKHRLLEGGVEALEDQMMNE